ncbi:pirin family protein [Parasalinivibrio latis]|uniref:pirin family protein n=1 Tax=Parasalinivibrio latis TaxID=2952610 RepID=UPI0030E47E9E
MSNVTIKQIIASHASNDGDGVRIQRVHGFNNKAFSPFLMIDELKSSNPDDYIGGFPPHPHRGIETLTYMLEGHFQHKDHMGNVGELKSGGAQWMSAGRGVIHSEMPIMEEGQLHGFQIWINMPAEKKMRPAQYHDFQPDSIVERATGNSSIVRVISGSLGIGGDVVTGPLQQTGIPATIADVRLPSPDTVKLVLNPEYQTLLYVYRGNIEIEGQNIPSGNLILLQGETLTLGATIDSGALILSGEPIDEPVVHYGPFVMNSMEEINQAITDYQNGTLV